MTRRVLLAFGALLVLLAGAAWQLPLRQLARVLPELSGGALAASYADGPWFDGRLHLACRTPNGRLLDCGRYAVRAEPARDARLRVVASQPAGGRLAASLSGTARELEFAGLRLPMAALAVALPVVEQMQFGGDVLIDGRADGTGQVALDLRWQSEVGEFATGEQRLRVEGRDGRYELRFLPLPDAAARPVALSGGVVCEISQVDAGARCRGEVEVTTDRRNAKFETLLTAAAPRLGPGRYRMRIDAQ